MENTQPIEVTIEPVRYAGFWRRLLSYLLDSIIMAAVSGILFGFHSRGINPDIGMFADLGDTFGMIAVSWLYFSFMESSKFQGTLGKMALNIKVIDMAGARISFGRATGRHFAKIISGIILGIGYLMIFWTEKKQGLHDRIAKTLVVRS